MDSILYSQLVELGTSDASLAAMMLLNGGVVTPGSGVFEVYTLKWLYGMRLTRLRATQDEGSKSLEESVEAFVRRISATSQATGKWCTIHAGENFQFLVLVLTDGQVAGCMKLKGPIGMSLLDPQAVSRSEG